MDWVGGEHPINDIGNKTVSRGQGVMRGLRFVFVPVIAWGFSALATQAPFTTGFITTGVETTAADAFAQLVVEGKERLMASGSETPCLPRLAHCDIIRSYVTQT